MMIVGPKIAMGLFLLSLSGACCGASLAADRKSDTFKLPEDVRAFMERRDGCDHFRGEDSPYAERRAQIDEELKRLCTGTDAELARLKRFYTGNETVQRLLAEYEVNIETEN
ncbi:hypothetical protein FHX08_004040 [Rhizobium sp. BK529]|uniref:hypothetical protein n=1 Tax=unclassified Rhizobium TaxID=2613769 RepID=UPI00104AD3A6|nr:MULTISPECIES: hypothetical protein [unclassified Rhizobium]MBB3593637.1 hypothetical protein [Rhizobium sp. BK529]TCS03425.1 hypothetical protein EV281_104508 [Rhizobium sp. BK418]